MSLSLRLSVCIAVFVTPAFSFAGCSVEKETKTVNAASELPPASPTGIRERIKRLDIPDKGFLPGFQFNWEEHPKLKAMTKEQDIIMESAKGCVRRQIRLVGGEIELVIAVSVHSLDLEAARDEFVNYVMLQAMLPEDAYDLGPDDLGDFGIGYADEIASGEIREAVHYMRANVGVTVRVAAGSFDIIELAHDIDTRLAALSTVDEMSPYCPQGLNLSISDTEIRVGDTLECSVTFDEVSDDTLTVFFAADGLFLREESRANSAIAWRAVEPTVTKIRATVCDSMLRSSSVEAAVKILDKESEASATTDESN